MLLLAWIAAIIIILTIHEFSHALAGTVLGDQTAKIMGRLTLNPLSHISWLGFFMLMLAGFGWGNPVPFNPYNLKYQRFGPAIVALAGPLANLIMAFISGFILRFLIVNQIIGIENLLAQFLNLLIVLNIVLMVFNLLPIPPLDGSKVLFSIIADRKYDNMRLMLEQRGPFILLLIIIGDNFLDLNILGGLFKVVINFVYQVIS